MGEMAVPALRARRPLDGGVLPKLSLMLTLGRRSKPFLLVRHDAPFSARARDVKLALRRAPPVLSSIGRFIQTWTSCGLQGRQAYGTIRPM